MKGAGFNVVRKGYLSWDSFEPRQGQFTFEWFDRIMDKMHAAGIRVILDIPGSPTPIWLHRAYPGVDIVNHAGDRVPPADRPSDFSIFIDSGPMKRSLSWVTWMRTVGTLCPTPPRSRIFWTLPGGGFDYLSTFKSYVSYGAEGFYPGDPVSGSLGALEVKGDLPRQPVSWERY